MATTTPNYGWPVPTSSDLVKNGATAIEALGDAADATMATMVAKAIVDAKGDIIAATAADTVSRLAVGANDTVLTADSSTATGLKWATVGGGGGGGKVLQVVAATTTTFASNSTTTYADTNLTATITPTLSTSKILVLVNQNGCGKGAANSWEWLRIMRGATSIIEICDSIAYTNSAAALRGQSIGASYLDSPATTSATTYKTQFRAETADTVYVQVNSSGTTTSTITLLEIGA